MRQADANAVFVGAVVSALGLFAWVQLPALCGFMFSSTRAGASNYRYSMVLGAIFAVLGLLSGARTALARPRAALLYTGMLVNVSFLLFNALAPGPYGQSCGWLYEKLL